MGIIKISGLEEATISPLSLVFLMNKDKILVLHRDPGKIIYPDRLSGVGGKVEPGEELFISAKREYFEETGLKLLDLHLRGTFVRVLEKDYFSLLYLFVSTKYEGNLKKVSDEGTLQWMKVDEFINYPKVVDHITYYLKQIVGGKDFYTGVGYYEGEKLASYSDNKVGFEKRSK